MRFWNIYKRALGVLIVMIVVMTTSLRAYCSENIFTSDQLQEYIQKVNQEWADKGYTINNTPNTSGKQSAGTQSETKTSISASEKTVSKTCEHSYVDTIIKEPTCAELGMMESKCSKCGDTYKTEIPATGKHTYTSEITKEATCTEKGETTYTCSVCGDSYTEEIPAKGHSYVSSVTKEATCTESGINTFTCSDCGDSYTEEIPATGHVQTAEVVTKEAGLFSKGEKVVKCTVCGEILSTEVIPSRYPISYLYIGIAVFATLLIAVFVIFRFKKDSIKSERKTA